MITKLFAVTDIALMPLNAVRLKKGSDELHLLFLEGESSYSLSEIVQPTMFGAGRLAGHRFSATLYVPQNDLNNITVLQPFTGSVLDEVLFDFGKSNADVTNYINAVNRAQTLTITNALEFVYRVENSEFRPRTICTLAGCVPLPSVTVS